LPSGRRVSGHLPSGRSCHGTTRPDAAVKATAFGRSRHGICLLDEECQGICLLDAARVFRTQNVMANSVWTTPVTAPRVQTQLSRRLRSDAAAMAYAFWTRSVGAFAFWTQRVSSGRRMSWQIASGRRLSRRHASRRSCHGTENRSEAFHRIRILGRKRLVVLGAVTQSSCIHISNSYICYLTKHPARAHSVASIIVSNAASIVAFIARKYHFLHTLFLTC